MAAAAGLRCCAEACRFLVAIKLGLGDISALVLLSSKRGVGCRVVSVIMDLKRALCAAIASYLVSSNTKDKIG